MTVLQEITNEKTGEMKETRAAENSTRLRPVESLGTSPWRCHSAFPALAPHNCPLAATVVVEEVVVASSVCHSLVSECTR